MKLGTDVELADIVTPDDQNVGFFILGVHREGRQDEGQENYQQ